MITHLLPFLSQFIFLACIENMGRPGYEAIPNSLYKPLKNKGLRSAKESNEIDKK